jgi:hypothetical protein
MRKVFDGIEKFLILRKLRGSCLEGRRALIQPIVDILTCPKAGNRDLGVAMAVLDPRFRGGDGSK